MTALYLEDMFVGRRFSGGPVTVDRDAIKAFAREYDPQHFHLNEAAADASFFRGLAASGWHTAAMSMRMMVESDLRPDGGVIGAGIEELQWPRAVRPGDVLRLELEVLDITPSRSKPQQGIVRVAMNTFNQNDEPVMHAVGRLLMFRRPAG